MPGDAEIANLFIRIEVMEKELKASMDRAEKTVAGAANTMTSKLKSFTKGIGSALGTISVVALGKEILDLGKAWDTVQADFAMNTGKMGKELDTYLALIRKLNTSTDLTLQESAGLIEVLVNKMNLTTDQVDSQMLTWESFMDVFKATPATVETLEQVMKKFGDTSWETKNELFDMATTLRQETNMSIDDLLGNLNAIAPQMKALGLGVKEATGFIGMMAKAGFDASEITMGLNTALQKIESPEQLYEIMQQIKDAPDDFTAASMAVDTFGARGGAKMAAALREGKVSIEEMTTSLLANKTAFEDAAAANEERFQEKLGPLVNKLKDFGMTLGTYMLSGLKTLIDWFTSSPTWVQIMIGSIIAVGAAIALAMSANPITLIMVAIAAFIAIVGVIVENWEPIKQFFLDLWGSITGWATDTWQTIKDWAIGTWDSIVTAWNAAGNFFTGIWDAITGAFKTAWDWINANVIQPIKDFFAYLASPAAVSGYTTYGIGAPVPAPTAPTLPSGWFGHQRGGSVLAGSSYVVGERGPEWFVPTQGGTVLPNDITSLLRELIGAVKGGRSQRIDQRLSVEVEAGPGSILELAAKGVRVRG